MNRRKFIKRAGITSACICGSALIYHTGAANKMINVFEAADDTYKVEGDKLIIDLESNKKLSAGEDALKLKFNYKGEKMKVLVFRKQPDTYMAFENRCTHGGMSLKYKSESGELRCTSFGASSFDLEGNVTGGPAPSPLKKFEVEQKENLLYVSLS